MKIEFIAGLIVVLVIVGSAIAYFASPMPKSVTSNLASGEFLDQSEKAKSLTLAPEISSPDGFVNTSGQPITLKEFRNKKVVLLDIWTYSCINCQRTLPYINDWYEKYKDQGLEIVGLHTPEFAFEKVLANVEKAVSRFGIKYPVVLDNDYSTWRAYGNNYWPRKYLIDIDGYIVYDHIGEGGYADTEKAIQKALQERNARLGLSNKVSDDISAPKNVVVVDSSRVRSPEVYFGSGRNEYLANGRAGLSGEQNLVLPNETEILPNKLYLGGLWRLDKEFAESRSEAQIVFKYEAKNVYAVMSAQSPAEIGIWVDDKLMKTIIIKEEQLYKIVEGIDYGAHILKLKLLKGGIKVFAFTFG